MKKIAQLISWLALAGTILPSFLFFGDRLTHDTMRLIMNVAMFVWFITAAYWMEHKAG